jgi:branched-chain amino acid transport system ATP-binding protein
VTPRLEVRDLTVAYGRLVVVHGVSLRVEPGTVTTLIGSNGAGKTTTLKSIAGLLRPQSGDILLDGEPIAALPTDQIVSRGVVLVPEGRRIFPNLTVRENLRLGAFACWDRKRVEADLTEMLQLFPLLRDKLGRLGGVLSGGEQQMLAIARALMSRPRVLLLDEPSMGLAPKLVAEVFSMIEAITHRGPTILLVEQNARVALACSDYGYVLEGGRIVFADRAARLLESDAVRQAYLGE